MIVLPGGAPVGRGARALPRTRPARPPVQAEPRPARRPVSDDAENGDRFEDLSIGERLAERDRTHPEPARRPEVPRAGEQVRLGGGHPAADGPRRPAVRRRRCRTRARGSRGPEVGQPAAGVRGSERAPGDKEGDANVCQKAPCNKNAGKVPACEVRGNGHRERLPEGARRARDDVRGHARHRLRAAGGPRGADPRRASRACGS